MTTKPLWVAASILVSALSIAAEAREFLPDLTPTAVSLYQTSVGEFPARQVQVLAIQLQNVGSFDFVASSMEVDVDGRRYRATITDRNAMVGHAIDPRDYGWAYVEMAPGTVAHCATIRPTIDALRSAQRPASTWDVYANDTKSFLARVSGNSRLCNITGVIFN